MALGGLAEDSLCNKIARDDEDVPSLRRIMEMLDVYGLFGVKIDSLPFALFDTTAGTETELQAVVAGEKGDVDLPITIEKSNYFANIVRRVTAGDTTKKTVTNLERFLNSNTEKIWEHSWVRFPAKVLCPFAQDVLRRDLLADKEDPAAGTRTDINAFLFSVGGEEFVRLPVSYLIKLCLADVLGSQKQVPSLIHSTGCRLMRHFLNDNTSPESFSFHVVSLRPDAGMGKAIAREAAKRFLLTHLLVMYGNRKFALEANGEKAMVYSSPHPPVRLRELNDCISDSFYRELFMNPCLSGWNRGEAKHEYMHLCHSVLSRSQLNAVAKLREAGIINTNLVVFPNTSNISLANNGTHISMGSRKLTKYLTDKSSGLDGIHEKYMGDLAIKVVEHFLPLFAGTYSAAPYRLDFSDMHPEMVLGFLPHELDYTHLRMLWRRWQKKAHMKIFGRVVTPFGPDWLDRMISLLFRLKGDFIPDFRLIDYLVSLMSTEKSPALDGSMRNHDRLKRDLSDLGIFDTRMSIYLLYRLREYGKIGFSGFEGRHYSLFECIGEDMGRAADLQNLLNVLAFKYMAQGEISHAHIPDDPFVESERRQIIFGSAIGIPTFFVRHDTKNLFLKRIIGKTDKIRLSRRYPGYLRVYNQEYRKALLRALKEDAADLIEMLGLAETMEDLNLRLTDYENHSTVGRLTKAVIEKAGAKSPLNMKAAEFNRAAEGFYRNELKVCHLEEAFRFLEEDMPNIEAVFPGDQRSIRSALQYALNGQDAAQFVSISSQKAIGEEISTSDLVRLINLTLISVHCDGIRNVAFFNERSDRKDASSVY
ncbi:MAG TPA: hypothetical protein VLZ07_01350 [Syntrophales bacterium]|nr:hypothetical protein [Syntrophales bacterium]